MESAAVFSGLGSNYLLGTSRGVSSHLPPFFNDKRISFPASLQVSPFPRLYDIRVRILCLIAEKAQENMGRKTGICHCIQSDVISRQSNGSLMCRTDQSNMVSHAYVCSFKSSLLLLLLIMFKRLLPQGLMRQYLVFTGAPEWEIPTSFAFYMNFFPYF